MNYEHLQYILEIKEFGSISKAAAHNFVSQPYLSTILNNFEKDLGMRLFIRTKNGVEVAPEAEEFFRRANKSLTNHNDFEHYCRCLTEDIFRVKVATVPFCYAEFAVNEMIKKTDSKHIKVRIGEFHSFDICKEIINGTYRLGFLSYNIFYKEFIEKTVRYNNLEYVEIAKLTPEIIISKHHPALEEIKEDISQIQHYPAIMQTVVSEDVVDITSMFEAAGVKIPQGNYIMTDHTTHLYFASEGTGIIITPHINFYGDLLEKYELVAIPIQPLEDTISLGYVYNKDYVLIDCLKQLLITWEETVKNFLEKA